MSNAQSWAQTFAPIAEANYQAVIQNTWGHLAPEKNKTYKGQILFAKSEYESGSIKLIATKFEDMPDSPWMYDALQEYVNSFRDLEYSVVYRIAATVRNYRFWGKPVKALALT